VLIIFGLWFVVVNNMEGIFELIQNRNEQETTPFQSIHADYSTLLNQIDALHAKCEGLEREVAAHQESVNGNGPSPSMALKNETRLRDKLEKLQEDLNEKLSIISEEQAAALETTKELNQAKDRGIQLESQLSTMEREKEKQQRIIDHQSTELKDAISRTNLAEKQYLGLKETIRILQQENDLIRKDNRELEKRLMTEKEKISRELLSLMESADKLKRENEMLSGLKVQEEKRTSWFGLSSLKKESKSDAKSKDKSDQRQWGTMGVILPSEPKHIIKAHTKEGSCLRYDSSGADVLVTGSPDATVKVWDTSTGKIITTLRGGTSNAILSCDVSNGIVVAGGTDKNCRQVLPALVCRRLARFKLSIA
jgi:autophagy-related protein 16-1